MEKRKFELAVCRIRKLGQDGQSRVLGAGSFVRFDNQLPDVDSQCCLVTSDNVIPSENVDLKDFILDFKKLDSSIKELILANYADCVVRVISSPGLVVIPLQIRTGFDKKRGIFTFRSLTREEAVPVENLFCPIIDDTDAGRAFDVKSLSLKQDQGLYVLHDGHSSFNPLPECTSASNRHCHGSVILSGKNLQAVGVLHCSDDQPSRITPIWFSQGTLIGGTCTTHCGSGSISDRFRDIKEESCHSKRTASEAFESKGISRNEGTRGVHQDLQPAHKCSKSEASGDQSIDASNEDLDTKVVVALDYSSSVSDANFEKEFTFVKQMAESWNIPLEDLVVYGDCATTVPFDPYDDKMFSVPLRELKTNLKWSESKCRRMDLALTEAARNFNGSAIQHQLVVLITAGRQVSGEESKEDDRDLLVSASEALSCRNIKIVVVPVGLETDFKELGLIVKRPQSLFPLSSFDDMTPGTAQNMASNIMKTIDIETFAKETFCSFSGIPRESGLWENISLCSDVMEGAWYILYDDQKKPNKNEKLRLLIQESFDNFQSKLVTESKMCISVCVCGPLGAGKSFLLNSLLNLGLPEVHKGDNEPLPSGFGGHGQTPLPTYIQYGKNVQVLLHKQGTDARPAVWFFEEELGGGTLTRVKSVLQTKFQEVQSLIDARCVELQGPFPVFHAIKERAVTSSGHLKFDVDVEFVDLPGYGDNTGNESISVELSKADVVLFFDLSKSGRPVSSEDIAHIFRRHEELEFTSRPKLVHIVNDTEPSSVPSCSLDLLYKEKKEDLSKAWSHFLSSSSGDDALPGCYREVRAKLPHLNAEALLEKLSHESEVIYFHSENSDILLSLKNIINDHVQSVKIKQAIHPFLQNVHWAARKLETGIGHSLHTEKKKMKPVQVKLGEAVFQLLPNVNEASDLIRSFMDQTHLPLESDIESMYQFLYDTFLYSSETLSFLLDLLKESLESFTIRLVNSFMNANWSSLRDIPSDVIDLVEMVCRTRVQQFCANSAPAYLLHVLDLGRNRNPFRLTGKMPWSSATVVEKKDLCHEFLHVLLHRTEVSLEKETREKQHKKSHFQLLKELKEVVREVFAVRSFDNACSADCLKLLNKKLTMVIEFCNNSIREINPHPSLEVPAVLSLPEKMVDVHEDNRVPLQSSFEKIIKETTESLLKARSKGADVIHKLESKLNFKKHELRLSESVDQRLWAMALVNVLSDKDHFHIELEPSLVLDHHDAQVEELLNLARKRLFAYQRSSVTCKIVNGQSLPENEIHLRKSIQEENCLDALVSVEIFDKLDAIHKEFKDPSQHLAPIFIPTIRPGPTPDITGNYFLEEDPWSKSVLMGETKEEESGRTNEKNDENAHNNGLVLNLFLVVEPEHLETLQTTIHCLQYPTANKINLMYVVLPQNGRGIGVTRAIIKSLAECFKFSLYWTIDDDIQFMYQFDGNDHRWHKCSLTRGLLFGQRVFQTCLEKTVKELSDEERDDLLDDLTCHWPRFAKKTQRRVRALLIDRKSFAEVQKNPALLHSPFANISEDCDSDVAKEEELKAFERYFVHECRKRLFENTINHIAGISIAHESIKRYDYMSKYPTADYMRSEQRYQVVLNNACALKGKNFVTDDMVLHDQEFQVYDEDKRNTPYWGIRGSEKSFCHALKVSGVIGYRVIRIVHSHKKLRNVFDRVCPPYFTSQLLHISEQEDEDDV